MRKRFRIVNRNGKVLQITVTDSGSFLTHLLLQMENISLYSEEAVQNFTIIRDFIALFYWD